MSVRQLLFVRYGYQFNFDLFQIIGETHVIGISSRKLSGTDAVTIAFVESYCVARAEEGTAAVTAIDINVSMTIAQLQ